MATASNAGRCLRPAQCRHYVLQRPGRPAGLWRSREVVSPRRRARKRHSPEQSRLCTTAAKASRRTTFRRTCGLAASRSSAREDRDEAVSNRNVVASKMSREQLVEAKKLLREWKPKLPAR